MTSHMLHGIQNCSIIKSNKTPNSVQTINGLSTYLSLFIILNNNLLYKLTLVFLLLRLRHFTITTYICCNSQWQKKKFQPDPAICSGCKSSGAGTELSIHLTKKKPSHTHIFPCVPLNWCECLPLPPYNRSEYRSYVWLGLFLHFDFKLCWSPIMNIYLLVVLLQTTEKNYHFRGGFGVHLFLSVICFPLGTAPLFNYFVF